MAEKPTDNGAAWDVETIRLLADLMSKHDLSEVTIGEGAGRLRLRRGPQGGAFMMPAPAMAPASAPHGAPAQASAAAEPPRPAKKLLEIKSEGPGTFFSRPKPGADTYVKLGSPVTPTTVVGLIGAMKIYTDIVAGFAGTIAEICVEDEQAVEFGTVLFRVDPG